MEIYKYPRTFDLEEVWLFDVLLRQTTCEMEALQVQVYIQQWLHDYQGAKFMWHLVWSEITLSIYLTACGKLLVRVSWWGHIVD